MILPKPNVRSSVNWRGRVSCFSCSRPAYTLVLLPHQPNRFLEIPSNHPSGAPLTGGGWFFAEMPLAGHACKIASIPQQRGDAHNSLIQIPLVSRLALLVGCDSLSHRAKTSEMVVCATEQHRPSWRTRRCCVEVAEQHAGLRQGVEVRRANLSAKWTNVRVAHIVHHDEQNVGTIGCSLCALASAHSHNTHRYMEHDGRQYPAKSHSWFIRKRKLWTNPRPSSNLCRGYYSTRSLRERHLSTRVHRPIFSYPGTRSVVEALRYNRLSHHNLCWASAEN